jgi:intracellular multiplication protein IcmE
MQATKDVCLAAANDAARQRCVRALQAASAGSLSSSLQDLPSAVALTRDLIGMQSLSAINAVLAALGKAAAKGLNEKSLHDAGFDVKELKAAGFDAVALKSAGFEAAALKAAGFDLVALRAAGFNFQALIAAGFDSTAFEAAGLSEEYIEFSNHCYVSR